MKNKFKLLTFLCVPFMLAGCTPKCEEHKWDDGVVTLKPTEDAEGAKTYTCTVCKETKTEPIPAHKHSWDNGKVTIPATEDAEGEMTYTCKTCKETKTEIIPIHQHTWDTGWTSNETQHWHKCIEKDNGKDCKEKNSAVNHSFGEWVIDSYAKDVSSQWGGSQKQNGKKHRTCSVCKYKQEADVEDYDPSIFDPSKVDDPTDKYTPKYQRDYHFFDDGAPVIKFTVTNDPKGGTSTNFATKPNKSKGGGDPWEVSGNFTVDNCPAEYDIGQVTGGMKVRGNYTTDYEKKGFRIKFDEKQNLFGLNGGKTFKKWVLFADVKDNSMLRNAMSFYMAERMSGDNVFVTDFIPAHLYINNQYWGLYLLAEQKEAKKQRISLPEPTEGYAGTDIGYCFEMDKYASEEAAKGEDGDPTFNVNYSPALSYSPHSGENRYNCNGFINSYTMLTDITNRTTQLPYIKSRVEMAYKVLYNAAKSNKLTEIVNEQVVNSSETDVEKCLAKTIDIDSFVDMYLFNEIVCDPDIGYSSFYLSLDMSPEGDHLLRLDNPWDFDSALGVRTGTLEDAQGLYAAKSSNMWLSILSNMTWFKEKVKAKWNQLRENELFEKSMEMIEDYSINYVDDYKKNFDRWPKTMGNNPETNFEVRSSLQRLTTERQAEQALYNWFGTRIDYLETQFGTGRASILPEGSGSTGGGGGTGGGGNNNPPATDYSAFKANATKTRLEAEAKQENLSGNCKIKNKDNEGISGNSYVGDLNPSGGSVTFTYNAAKAGEALLTVGLSARTDGDHKLTDLFDIKVNGVSITSNAVVARGNGTDFHCWTSVDAGMINLNAGNNTIVFTAQQTSTNFDYIDIYVAK